jgi:hypothetical protein
MDWSPILAELPKAVPTLISAIVGGLLVLGGQRLTHRYTRQREHERLLREKAEELIYALTQLPDWVDATITAQLRRADYHTPSPLDRAYTLQVLYFPQLAPHFSTIREALNLVWTLLATLVPQVPQLSPFLGSSVEPLSVWQEEEAKMKLQQLQRPYLAAVGEAIEALLAMPLWQSTGPVPRPPRYHNRLYTKFHASA